jgi:hypothetical protein
MLDDFFCLTRVTKQSDKARVRPALRPGTDVLERPSSRLSPTSHAATLISFVDHAEHLVLEYGAASVSTLVRLLHVPRHRPQMARLLFLLLLPQLLLRLQDQLPVVRQQLRQALAQQQRYRASVRPPVNSQRQHLRRPWRLQTPQQSLLRRLSRTRRKQHCPMRRKQHCPMRRKLFSPMARAQA